MQALDWFNEKGRKLFKTPKLAKYFKIKDSVSHRLLRHFRKKLSQKPRLKKIYKFFLKKKNFCKAIFHSPSWQPIRKHYDLLVEYAKLHFNNYILIYQLGIKKVMPFKNSSVLWSCIFRLSRSVNFYMVAHLFSVLYSERFC